MTFLNVVATLAFLAFALLAALHGLRYTATVCAFMAFLVGLSLTPLPDLAHSYMFGG